STSWTRRSCPSPPCRGRTERLTPSGRPRSSTARPRRLRAPTLTAPPSRPRLHPPAFTTSPIRTDARFAPFSIRCPYPWWKDLTASLVGALSKAALHDHLDGGLRAETVLELSQELGLEVPGLEAPLDEAPDAEVASGGTPPGDVTADTPAAGAPTPDGPAADATTAEVPPADAARAVADWFHSAADSGSLPAYLSTFERTAAVMQTAPQLRRIAREFVEDMVADGVVYAETRWAPHQHTDGGLTPDEAVQAVQDGLDEGVAAAEAAGRRIVVGQLLCYLR